jgi:hypothetical protein
MGLYGQTLFNAFLRKLMAKRTSRNSQVISKQFLYNNSSLSFSDILYDTELNPNEKAAGSIRFGCFCIIKSSDSLNYSG